MNPLTNEIPKVLVNVGQEPALISQIKYWINQDVLGRFEKIYLVINEKYYLFTQSILNEYNFGEIVTIVHENVSDGSYAAIQRLFEKYSDLGDDTYLNWSDIIPVSDVPKDLKESIIFTNGKEHRYGFNDDGRIEVKKFHNGNIFGLYYIKDINLKHDYPKGTDLIECLMNKIDIKSLPMEKIIDFGDHKKLLKINGEMVCRSFNKIEQTKTSIKKIALDSKGVELQKLEVVWYNNLHDYAGGVSTLAPKHLNYDRQTNTLELERVHGQEAYKIYNLDLLLKIHDKMDELHSISHYSVRNDEINEDIKVEVIDKSLSRKESIQSYLDYFTNIVSVNETELLPFEQIITILNDRIQHINKDVTKYSFIHGDLNFSNILVDDEIKFIDPRGYFGNCNVYGLPSYDKAKTLYALSGYDAFNNLPSFGEYSIDKDNLNLNIEPLDNNFLFMDDLYTEEEYYWMALIWINLGGYFKNNPLKSVIAYYYGCYLATYLIEEKYPMKRNGLNILHSPINMTIKTKVPWKWNLLDNECKQAYVGTGLEEVKRVWKC